MEDPWWGETGLLWRRAMNALMEGSTDRHPIEDDHFPEWR